MLDLNLLKRAAEGGDGVEEVPITRDCLAQIVDELGAGRAAQARLGQCFGLPQGSTL
jgi:hypothetical protein